MGSDNLPNDLADNTIVQQSRCPLPEKMPPHPESRDHEWATWSTGPLSLGVKFPAGVHQNGVGAARQNWASPVNDANPRYSPFR
jgi:hypothetical protein